ncbi:hypothetical protein CRG98_011926 [Punica granatum]|uniref:Uncharacterized protein n=1 Tax=Punica granatum TaxID=22663 RepID=A0A2I0KHP3_PUNGR|nr:hypothetical protein CRG98_011926 [Punica granatum]
MALFSNIFSCFSDSTQENRRGYLCNGETSNVIRFTRINYDSGVLFAQIRSTSGRANVHWQMLNDCDLPMPGLGTFRS